MMLILWALMSTKFSTSNPDYVGCLVGVGSANLADAMSSSSS